MSVGPRPQLLALLWPWLLLATLQVRLAVAMAAERSSAAQKAIIRVVPFKLQPLTLEGVFASVAEVMPAEGKLLQSNKEVGGLLGNSHRDRRGEFHPLSLCNTSEDEHTVPGFVSIIKLERPQQDRHPCLSLANKAKLAGERGAHAVLFDITNDQSAADQLSQPRGLSHPVVLIWGHDAELLMGVVNNNREAHVKIEVKEMPAWPDYDVWILLTLLSTGLIIASIFIVRTRCQPSRSQTNVQEATLQAISRLATRRYQARPRAAPAADSVSSCSSAPVCAICLEEFSEGQELRIITCLHEFHRQCVDPWLQEHQTCPLCMFNIMEHISSASPLYPLEDPPLRGPGGRPRFFRQHPGRAFYRLPPMAATNCSAALPRGHPFFHSPELSQLDFGTMRYLPYRPVAPDPWCSHQPPLARSLLASQPQEPATREPAPPPRRTCPLAHPFPCRALRVPLAAKLSRGVPLQRGLRHSRHQHHQHYHHHAQSSGSGEMYRTEPSGYLPDGPGSDSSSGPCHGSSSDSVLNCTDASLQAIHGSCSTFHSSLSSDYDPFAFGGTERLASRNGRELPASWRDPQPQSLDPGTGGFSSHVHCHHHHHHHGLHHYGRSPSDGSTGRAGQDLRRTRPPRSRAGSSGPGAQLQKRTEKMLGQDGPSASPDATWARRSPSLRRGEPGRSVPEGPGGSGTEGDQAAAPGPWTSQNTRLQIHPGRRRWKSPHESSLLPPCSPVAQNVSHPRPPGPGSGTRCFQEVQPLLGPSPSELPAPALAQVSSPLARLSVTEPLGEGDTSLGHTDRKPLASGKCLGLEAMEANGSLSFKSPPGQHLQGSDNDDAPDVFEHSV